jgi:hypothetical protein
MTVGTAVPDAKPARSETRPPKADAAAEADRKASKHKGREAEPAAPPRSQSEQTATAIAATQPAPKETGSQRRLAYQVDLVSLMRRLQGAGLLGDLNDDDVARRLEVEIASKAQAGKSVPKLPQRRHIANHVAKLRPKILSRS